MGYNAITNWPWRFRVWSNRAQKQARIHLMQGYDFPYILYDWTSFSEWKFDKTKWWVLMGQTCGHGTTRHKIEYTFRSKTGC